MPTHIDPEVLHRVAKEVLSADLESGEMFDLIRSKLHEEYPHLIAPEARCWIGSRAGGVLGKMTFLYGSLNEYLIIFGCPAGTAGFSGRYNFMEIWDFFLSGETRTYDLESNQITQNIGRAGDKGYLGKGQSFGVEIEAGSWMIEYGRGPNVTALAFALMDSLISSVELKSFFLTLSEYTKLILRSFTK
jgi:hypothetical protein